MAKVLVLTLDGTGESRELSGGTLSAGRGQDNDWVLVDPGPTPTVSRRHCRFAVGPDGATVTDLGSTNGTRVDGRALAPRAPATLRGGEVVEIGSRRMLVDVVAEPWTPSAGLPAPPLLTPHPTGVDGVGAGTPPVPSLQAAQAAPARGAAGASRDQPDDLDLFADDSPPAHLRSAMGGDPLAGEFSEALPPLQRGRGPAPSPERSSMSGPPQMEAMLPRSATPLAPDPLQSFHPFAGQRAPVPEAGSGAGQNNNHDPFGFNSADAPSPSEPAAEPPKHAAGKGRHAAEGAPGGALLAAFLEGAGQEASVADGRDSEDFLRETGRVFARLANGLRELLAVRATVKDHVRLDRTQIGAALNNPLKLSVSGREATAALLGRGEEGYLAPLAAVDAGFRDLKAHELAILEGVQSAVEELLELFDPAQLERKLDDAGMLATLIQGGRRARLWELYQERYGNIAGAARTRFMGRLDDAFRSAYARKSAEVSALADASSPGEPRP
jgi:type VI secretion system FHA domain protein